MTPHWRSMSADSLTYFYKANGNLAAQLDKDFTWDMTFFDGYSSIVWMAIVFQAVGGVLTSLCINYADNIAKNFATSISIIISFLFSVFCFGFNVTFPVS